MNKVNQAYGHLQSLECCIKNIIESLPAASDIDSMVLWDHIIVAQKELDMAMYILNNEEVA